MLSLGRLCLCEILSLVRNFERAEARAKVRLALMKKLAGTTWGADTVILKKLYTGRVRPVLEYGMTAWGTTAKSNFDRVSKVQNQATRIITGAMKSTPIMELETITGVQSLDDCRDFKLLSQAAKFKRLQDHPMRQRLSQPTKGRLKRESFIYQSKIIERQEDILDHDPKVTPLPPPPPPPLRVLPFLPGVRELLPSFCVPSLVLARKTPKAALRENPSPRNAFRPTTRRNPGLMCTLMALLRMQFGMEGRESTSSTQEAEKTESASLPGLYSTNYKAEAEALKTAAAHIEVSIHASPNVVLLTDALSVLQALQSNRDTELNDLSAALSVLQTLQSNRDTELNDLSAALSVLQTLQSNRDTELNDLSAALSVLQTLQSNRDTELNDLSAALASLCRSHAITLQWIPSRCNMPDHEAADSGKGWHDKRASG